MYRRILWVVLAVVVVTGTPAQAAKTARDTSDWANVQGLKPGTLLLITMKNGFAVRGNFERASDTSVEVIRWDGGGEETLARDEVKTVTPIVGQGLGPDQVRKRLLIGAAIGAVVGAAVGGSRDLRQGTNYKWAIGAPAGAILAIPVAGAVTIVEIEVQSAKLRGKRMVYASR